MGDWFETRFRERDDRAPVDPAFAARVRALVVEEWQADGGAHAPRGTETHLREGDLIMLDIDDPRTTEARPEERRPRRRWPLVAAAAAVVAVVAVGALASDDDEREVDTAGETDGTDPAVPSARAVPMPYGDQMVEVEPGTYSMDPDEDPSTPLRVEYEIAHAGWRSWPGAVKFDERQSHTALSIIDVRNLVTDACADHRPADPPVGPTVDDLATALAGLAPFEVTSPPTPVTRYGYSGVHLQWTVPDIPASGDRFTTCSDGKLRSWISQATLGAFFGYNAEPGRTEDFWILDVEGSRVVLAATVGASAPAEDVRELEEILDSVRIVP